ncbi:hypothetical protein ACHWQZ_G017439 [Mnemiopsis leidyi]
MASSSSSSSSSSIKKNKVSIPDANYIREMFNTCENPIKAINQFQIENGLQIASLEPVLPLLDLHSISRVKFHHSVIRLLQSKLNKKLEGMPRESLEKMLKQAFSQIQHKELCPVALEIMKLLNPVPSNYLKKLAALPDVYKQCSIEVKRQVWEKHQGIFGDEVRPILNKYIWEKDVELHKGSESLNAAAPFFAIAPRKRRESPVVQQLKEMIGLSFPLYQMMLIFVRTLYQRNKTSHFCTLRSDMLMSFHDCKIQDIYKQDPCHDFAFYIQYAVNEKRIQDKIQPKLKEFYIKIVTEKTELLSDTAIILADPYVLNVFCMEVFSCLHNVIEKENLPRNEEKLHFLLKFINLGINAWSIVNEDSTEEPKLHKTTLKENVPLLMICLVEDILHHEMGTKYRDNGVSNLVSCTSKDSLVKTLVMHYVLTLAQNRNIERLTMVLPLIPDSISTLDEVFMHVLVSYLLQYQAEWKQAEFCKAVFNSFLNKYGSDEVVLRHVLRLLWTAHVHLDPELVTETLENIAPQPNHSSQVRDLFMQLSERTAVVDT